MFYTTLPHPTLDSRLNIGLLSFDGRSGLPNSLREALLQQGLGEVSLTLDALFASGFVVDSTFTIKKALGKLRDAAILLSEGLLRRALNSGLFKSAELATGKRGRRERQYWMPDVMALIKQYANGVFSATDPLENVDMPDLKGYRQGLHRQFIRRAPGIYSRKFLARRLGIGKRTTRNYDLRLGIRAIRRLSLQSLRWISNWESVVLAGEVGVNWLRVHYDDGRYFDAPLNIGIARKHLWRHGVKDVSLVTQLCNRYVYSPDADWADYQFLRLHDDERVLDRASSNPFGLRDERMPTDPVSATQMIDRKAYSDHKDPLPGWLPPEMSARRISTNPFAKARSG